MAKRSIFNRVAQFCSRAAGHPAASISAAILILLWAGSYPFFDDFDTWQLVINTTTTIVTFLMVFLIQNTQNRDSAALQIKLDALIHASDHADDALMDLEELDEKSLEKIRRRYERLAEKARETLKERGKLLLNEEKNPAAAEGPPEV